MAFMWYWALIASAILAAVFLVIALAQMEAGVKARGKWLTLAFCSLAVAAGLIILKPKPNMEQIQYIPSPAPFQEQAPVQKSEPESSNSAGGLSLGGKNQGGSGGSQGVQGTNAQSEVAQLKAQWESNGDEYRDPVFEEIMLLKRLALERKNAAAAMETSEGTVTEEGIPALTEAVEQESNSLTDREKKEQTVLNGQEEHQAKEGGEKEEQQKTQSQKAIKARVSVTLLNIRDQAGLEGQIIGTLKSGDVVEVLNGSGTGEWAQIKLNSGVIGWVLKKYIEVLP